MKPHDLIVLNSRIWEVTGQYLGGLGQESVIGLRARDMTDATAHGEPVEEMFVPMSLLSAACNTNVAKHYTLANEVDRG